MGLGLGFGVGASDVVAGVAHRLAPWVVVLTDCGGRELEVGRYRGVERVPQRLDRVRVRGWG